MKPLLLTLLLDLPISAFWAWWTERLWIGGLVFVMVAAYATARRRVLEAWYYEFVQALVIGGFFAALMARPV